MIPDWEHGSDFHWIDGAGRHPTRGPWRGQSFGNGRQALIAALRHLDAVTVWLPDYYCLDVTHAVIEHGFRARNYAHCPGHAPGHFDPEPGDVAVAVDFFGWGVPDLRGVTGVDELIVLEDRTHRIRTDGDRWFASLRKTLPVPDGGWLALGDAVPEPEPLAEHLNAANRRLSGMLLKREYLAGRMPDKGLFRAESVEGERNLAAAPSLPLRVSVELATRYDWRMWEDRRRLNWQAFRNSFTGSSRLCGGDTSTFVVLECRSREVRDELRDGLVGERVYPAVLWDLEHAQLPVSGGSRTFSETMLALHCDGRYDEADMRRVAALCSRDR